MIPRNLKLALNHSPRKDSHSQGLREQPAVLSAKDRALSVHEHSSAPGNPHPDTKAQDPVKVSIVRVLQYRGNLTRLIPSQVVVVRFTPSHRRIMARRGRELENGPPFDGEAERCEDLLADLDAR